MFHSGFMKRLVLVVSNPQIRFLSLDSIHFIIECTHPSPITALTLDTSKTDTKAKEKKRKTISRKQINTVGSMDLQMPQSLSPHDTYSPDRSQGIGWDLLLAHGYRVRPR
jgi:hypothetical protein